jgi:hypothetical protein
MRATAIRCSPTWRAISLAFALRRPVEALPAFAPVVMATPAIPPQKNSLFAGHDLGAECWAMISSLLETCKLNSLDPLAWLTDLPKTSQVVADSDPPCEHHRPAVARRIGQRRMDHVKAAWKRPPRKGRASG